MDRKLIMTADGSHTVETEEGVTFHSIHGAIQESEHIFINAGLVARLEAGAPAPLRIFEPGLGTGLNALLSLVMTAGRSYPIHYEAIEARPLEEAITDRLNYCQRADLRGYQPLFSKIHAMDWGIPEEINPGFRFIKNRAVWPEYRLQEPADLVYYDAFDPQAQPELWSAAAFETLYSQLAPGAMLVTYCCKGEVRRALRATGFLVEKLPGPPGKREMLRARVPYAKL